MKKLLITVNGRRYEVEVEVVRDDEAAPLPQSQYLPTQPAAPKPPAVPSPATARKPPVPRADMKTLTSPITGIILEIPVKAGQAVAENDTLFILEAMKMKTNISSPQAGTIKSIDVSVGDTVAAGRPLLTFE